MSKTKTTETSNEENNKSVPTKSVKKKVDPIVDKIKQLDERGFDINRIAAMLMIHKSLVKQVLK